MRLSSPKTQHDKLKIRSCQLNDTFTIAGHTPARCRRLRLMLRALAFEEAAYWSAHAIMVADHHPQASPAGVTDILAIQVALGGFALLTR